MSRYLLSLLLLLAPLAAHAGGSWSSTDAAPAYGEIGDADSTTPIALTTAGTWYALGGDAIHGPSSGGTTVTTTPSAITIGASGGGMYRCSFYTCASGSSNLVLSGALFNGSTMIKGTKGVRKLSAAGDVGSFSGVGLVRLAASDVVTLKFSGDGNSKEVTPCNCSVVCERIGP
jgi:hypothetical protein